MHYTVFYKLDVNINNIDILTVGEYLWAKTRANMHAYLTLSGLLFTFLDMVIRVFLGISVAQPKIGLKGTDTGIIFLLSA